MRVFNGYPVSIIVSVLFHGLVLLALFFFQQANTEVIDIVRPPSVKALLVAENPQTKNAELQQQRQAQRLQDQRREEQRRQEQARAEAQRVQEQQRQEAQRQEQQERATALRRQEQEQRQAEQQRVAEAQKQREEQQRREQEQQRQQQALAAQQEAVRQEQARQEQAQREAAAGEAARTDAELVMAYSAVIHDLVQQNWSRPPSARNGMVVVLRIRMVPTGDVLDVTIEQSSGDFAFDRAAENAVLRVRRFTELQGMPTRLFDRNFRTFLLTFRPQDLLN